MTKILFINNDGGGSADYVEIQPGITLAELFTQRLPPGKRNPTLLARYIEVERRIGHTFRKELPLADIQDALNRGEQPGRVQDWTM